MEEKFIREAFKRGLVYDGNPIRIKKVFDRAKNGETLKIAFLGGSITQGCHATEYEKQYTRRVFNWFVKTFPAANFEYICAPVGGTDSQYGGARVKKQVLDKKPDMIFIEFAVNDWGDDFHKETYEGLIRRVIKSNEELAVMTLMNVIYNERGDNAQPQHLEILKSYKIPAVSMKNSFYEEYLAGRVTENDMTTDGIHPNDFGHEMVAGQLCAYLDRVLAGEVETKEESYDMTPVTANHYEKAVWLKNNDCSPVLNGFEADNRQPAYEHDFFIGGWKGYKKGDSFEITFTGKALAIQYIKFAKIKASRAKLIIDGDENKAYELDSNFDEDWGDSLYIQTIFTEDETKEHSLRIVLDEVPEEAKPFYILSVIYYE